MNRQAWLGAAVAALMASQAAAQETTLTGVTYIPPSYADLAYGFQGFVERANAADPDALAIDFYDSGRLVSADEQLPALRSGNVDLMFHTTSYITRSLPILGITGLPGVVDDLYAHPERLRRGAPLFELVAEELRGQGIETLTLGGGLFEPEYVWSTKAAPIASIEDIDGKRVRVVSFEATDVMEEFGAGAVRVPSSELYLAMQRGTVDAAVANISTINGRDIDEQVGQVYKLPLTSFSIGIFMQKDRWDALPDEAKAALTEAAEWFEDSSRAANEDYFAAQYWPAFEAEGIEIVEPDEAALQRLEEASQDVREAWVAEVGEDVGRRAIALALGEEG